MAKEYTINNKTYLFSKEKFQSAVQKMVKEKRCELDGKYTYSEFYNDLANEIGVSDETVRKWYSNGGPSPVDSALVEAVSEFLGLNDVTELLEEKEKDNMMSHAIENNVEREFIKHIFQEILAFAERYVYGEYNNEDNDLNIKYRKIMDALQTIHLLIDKAALDIKSETAKKLHDILLTYEEDLMAHSISAKWEPLCSEDYWTIRGLFNYGYQYQYRGNDEELDQEMEEYIKKIYPRVYDDEDDYLDIEFTTEFFYLSEFSKSLINVFRNDFPEAFLFD